ncbi:hypothetical protein ACFQJC_01530 [Haloferax namakaokahaiae]|uniref:Uncharacterized protein n=1 Tax=Haloferax namakaokahaiae TaxID=1748331 RepID=A0ABD5ZAJ0_9EURY
MPDATETSSGEPSDKMRERGTTSRLKLRVYLQANRWLVAVAPLVVIFCSILAIGVFDPTAFPSGVQSSDPIETLGQGLLTSIVTGVTLVVTINQLVLSQELGPLGDQRDRMEGELDFRNTVSELIDAPVAPPEPSAFLRSLTEAIEARAEALIEAVEDEPDSETKSRLTTFASEVSENANAVSGRLEGKQFGTFDVISAALDLNYSWKLYQAARLRNTSDDVSDATNDALAALSDALKLFGPAREHIKTLYFRWELVNLSRSMFYAALPALVVSISAILFLDDSSVVTGSTLGFSNLLIVTAFVSAVSLAPFAILAAYVLRIATVAKRTLSIGPFVLRTETREDNLDWEGSDEEADRSSEAGESSESNESNESNGSD